VSKVQNLDKIFDLRRQLCRRPFERQPFLKSKTKEQKNKRLTKQNEKARKNKRLSFAHLVQSGRVNSEKDMLETCAKKCDVRYKQYILFVEPAHLSCEIYWSQNGCCHSEPTHQEWLNFRSAFVFELYPVLVCISLSSQTCILYQDWTGLDKQTLDGVTAMLILFAVLENCSMTKLVWPQ